VAEWLPALDGVTAKLEQGARVADVGCGHGASTVIMAQAFPNSEFYGFDYHAPSIERAREAAEEAGVADRIRFESLDGDGTWMIVEPHAGDRVQDNLNPVGRVFYGASTVICTPASLAQEVGLALGAQAGEARIRDVVTQGGFTRFRRAAETPFNLILEARP